MQLSENLVCGISTFLIDIFWKGRNCLTAECDRYLGSFWKRNHAHFTAELFGKILQGCHGQGKISGKWNFFQVREKVREFCGWSGKFRKDLESQGKVRELENKWLWQENFRKLFFSVQEGKRCTFSWDSLSPSPPPPPATSLGATLIGKNLLPWGANSFL